MHDTLPLLRAAAFPPLRCQGLATLQVNLGHRCRRPARVGPHTQTERAA